jgi:tetratricopeptide (TPR) repeat protein
MRHPLYFFALKFLLFCLIFPADSFGASCVKDEASFNLGIKFSREENHARAIEMFSKFIASNKGIQAMPACKETTAINLASAHYNRGNAYLLNLDIDKAISDFTEAITIDPDVPAYYYYRGLAYAKNIKIEYPARKKKQMADLMAAVKLDPKYGLKALYMLGHDLATYKVIAEYPDETADIQKIIDAGMDLNLADNDGRTALMYTAGWGHAEALKLLLSKGVSPNRADKFGSTALIFAIAEGRDAIVPLLESHAVSEKEFRALASYYLLRNDLPKAAAAINRALLLDEENPENRYVQGNILMANKNYDGAIAAFQKTLALSPNHKHALYKLSLCYGSKAMEAAPDDYFLLGNQANLQLKAGDIEKAIELYGLALKAVLENMKKEKNPRKFQSASWYALFLTKFPEAEKYVKEGLGLNTQAHDLRSNLGHAYLFQGRKSEAILEYRKYIEQDPKRSVSGFIDSLNQDFVLLKLRYPEKKPLVEWIESQLYMKN